MTDFLTDAGKAPSDEVPQGVYPTVVTRDDGKALVVQCFMWAKYLCELHVTFDDEGQVVNYSGNPWLLNSAVMPGEGVEGGGGGRVANMLTS